VPTVHSSTYIDHESGETITVYWIVNERGSVVYTDASGRPK